MLRSAFTGGLAAIALSMSLAAAAAADEVWRIQSLFPPDNINHKAMQQVADNVEVMSDGRLVLELVPVKQIVGPTGTLEAVKNGIIEGHFTWPGLWAGIEPAFAIMADLPGGYPSAHEALDFYYYGPGLDLINELHEAQGLHTVGVFAVGTESLPSRVPIQGPADLEGLKVRLPGGITSEVMAAHGAAPVQLPFSEAFSALDKGVVDASDNSSVAENVRMGFHEHAKYAIYPGIHSAPILDLSVNKEKWDALPDDLKAIMKTAMHAGAEQSMYWRDAKDREIVRQIEAGELDVELIDWSEADRRAFREKAKQVWLEYAKNSPMTQKVVDAEIQFLQDYGLLD